MGRRGVGTMTPFMDYGPDWPPPPKPARRRSHPLLRRCVSVTLLWVMVWAACAVALHMRPAYELRSPATHAADRGHATKR